MNLCFQDHIYSEDFGQGRDINAQKMSKMQEKEHLDPL